MSDTTLPIPPRSMPDDDVTWIAIIDYVSGQASAATTASVEARVAVDPAYATRVATARVVYTLPLADLLDVESDDPTAAVVPPLSPPTSNPASAPAIPHPPVDVDTAWAAVLAALPPTPPRPAEPPRPLPLPRPRRRTPAAYASSIGGGLSSTWRRHPILWTTLALTLVSRTALHFDHRYWHPRVYYHTGTTTQVVTLPDGSVATLAPGAYLSTGRRYLTGTGTRDLYLFGQARFTVVPNPARPFIVHALEARATAVGTVFTVLNDTSARVTVDVETGTVVLSLPGPQGALRAVGVLTSGEVRRIPAMTRWFTHAGFLVGQAGVPFDEAIRIQEALLRAAARMMRPTP
ncbi:MAG TPA: FecR family protein [Gemmatimonadaceae bacterium]|jgi:hypothetical protein|nr:FecR family protein [Gemmatimonadaceae bacterium]